MKTYKVKVNGKVYVVELEEVKEDVGQIETSTKVETTAGDKELASPMAGTILKVSVNVGDKVSQGDVVCILEAMKLENEVRANATGVVKQINVSKGTQVTKGQSILVIG